MHLDLGLNLQTLYFWDNAPTELSFQGWTNFSVAPPVGKRKVSALAVSELKLTEIVGTEKVNLPEVPLPFPFICVKTDRRRAQRDCGTLWVGAQ